MSEANVDAVRRSFDLFMSGKVDDWLATIDPDVGWDISNHPLPDVPNHGRGRDSMLTDMLATYTSGWNDYVAEVKELIDAGEQVVLVLHETATMPGSDVPLDRDLVQLWTVHDGLLAFLSVFQTKADALRAAGVPPQP